MAASPKKTTQPTFVCPDYGAAMIIVEILARKLLIRVPPHRQVCHKRKHLPNVKPPARYLSVKADAETLSQTAESQR